MQSTEAERGEHILKLPARDTYCDGKVHRHTLSGRRRASSSAEDSSNGPDWMTSTISCTGKTKVRYDVRHKKTDHKVFVVAYPKKDWWTGDPPILHWVMTIRNICCGDLVPTE